MPDIGRYEYQHPYEWYWLRRARIYNYPQDFLRLPDAPRPFVDVIVHTSKEPIRKRVYLTDMRYLGE